MYAEISIILSLAVNLIATEIAGLSGGGMVVPGYLALYLEQPWRVAATFLTAVVTLLIVNGLSRFVVLYGRRRFTVMLLVGLLINALGSSGLLDQFMPFATRIDGADWRVIGYLIPGLIANDMARQGIFNTVLMTLILAMLVRILLIYIFDLGIGSRLLV